MNRTEWPVRINGRTELVIIQVKADATREECNDAALARAQQLGHDNAEPYYVSDTEPC